MLFIFNQLPGLILLDKGSTYPVQNIRYPRRLPLIIALKKVRFFRPLQIVTLLENQTS